MHLCRLGDTKARQRIPVRACRFRCRSSNSRVLYQIVLLRQCSQPPDTLNLEGSFCLSLVGSLSFNGRWKGSDDTFLFSLFHQTDFNYLSIGKHKKTQTRTKKMKAKKTKMTKCKSHLSNPRRPSSNADRRSSYRSRCRLRMK
jgi:hypothetical protein